jgi:hypothetical protein
MATYTFNFEAVVERDGEQVELACEIEHCSLVRGSRDGRFGPPLEPDEPEHCELSDWTPAIDLTEAEIEKIEADALESCEQRYDDGPDEYDGPEWD